MPRNELSPIFVTIHRYSSFFINEPIEKKSEGKNLIAELLRFIMVDLNSAKTNCAVVPFT